MTQSNQPPEVDPLETFEKRESVSFDPTRGGHAMGEWAMLEVDGYLELVDRRNSKKEVMRYDDGNPMKSIVLKVKEGGEDKALWGKKPGGLAVALAAAQASLREKTGEEKRRIRPGDMLAVRWAAVGPQPEDKMMNPPKIYEAIVRPGTLPTANTSADPFENAASQPAAPAQPTQQPVPATPRPAVGGDPFATSAAPAATPAPTTAPAAPAASGDPFATDSDPFGTPPPGEGPVSGDQPPY